MRVVHPPVFYSFNHTISINKGYTKLRLTLLNNAARRGVSKTLESGVLWFEGYGQQGSSSST